MKYPSNRYAFRQLLTDALGFDKKRIVEVGDSFKEMKKLYTSTTNTHYGEERMMKIGDVLRVWGPQHLAKGVERGLNELDRVLGKTGAPVYEKPSFYGNLIAAIGGAVAALKLGSPWDVVMAIYSGHHSTTLWDYLEEFMATGLTTRARVTYVPTAKPAPTPAPAPTAPAPAPAYQPAGPMLV